VLQNDGVKQCISLHYQNSDVLVKNNQYASTAVPRYNLPARVESGGGNVVSSRGKLQQLTVSLDDLVMLTVIVCTESTVKTIIIGIT